MAWLSSLRIGSVRTEGVIAVFGGTLLLFRGSTAMLDPAVCSDRGLVCSIAARRIDLANERLAGEFAAEIVDQRANGAVDPGDARDVGGKHDRRVRVERVPGGQGFGIGDVEERSG